MRNFVRWLFGLSPNVVRVVHPSDYDGPLVFPQRFANRVAEVHIKPIPARYIEAGERVLLDKLKAQEAQDANR